MITASAFLVAAAIGALARGAVLVRLNPVAGMPAGTLLVNVSGSFLLGWSAHLDVAALTVIGIGGLGAYTTFSTFALDTVRLIEDRRRAQAALYVAVMLGGSIAAAAAGIALA